MASFSKITSHAVVITSENIDTDQIIPARFLKVLDKDGLGKSLFCDWRYNADGTDKADFPLNFPASQGAQILLAGDNFGCGSSREHAPWALVDYGFRCVIAPSFADIFFNNCLKNGLLPVVLSEPEVERLFHECAAFPGFRLVVDLQKQLVSTTDGSVNMRFEVDAFRKHCLLNGLDEIGLTLRHADKIRAFEARRKAQYPWYF
jgi:3-isopropylmalate/(R)-2-methylmalate dehydratase small subunit